MIDAEISELSAPMLSRIANHQAMPNDKILVLARDTTDAAQWAYANQVNRSEYFAITTPTGLRGVQTGQYPRVRTNRFYTENPNANAIDRELTMRDDATRTPAWR